jgi:hypothetical protein
MARFPEDPTAESKEIRRRIQAMVDRLSDPANTWKSRSRSLAITKLQEARMWLGKDLGEQRDEGLNEEEHPYPARDDPHDPRIFPETDQPH